MNQDMLLNFLKENGSFEGQASELYKAMLAHRTLKNAHYVPSGATFRESLQMLTPKLEGAGLEVRLFHDGRVKVTVKAAAEEQEDDATDAKLRAEYDGSPDLRREFGAFARFAAYRRNVSNGRIRGISGGQNVINENRNPPNLDVDTRLPLEERCQRRWAVEPSTRREFHDNFAAFLAYERANAAGQVRQLKSRLAI